MEVHSSEDPQLPVLGVQVEQLDSKTVRPIVRSAIELGYRHFHLPVSEEKTRKFEEALENSGREREEFFLSAEMPPGKEDFRAALEYMNGLNKLTAGKLDILFLEPDMGKESFGEVMEAATDLQRQDRLEMIGLKEPGASRLEKYSRDYQLDCALIEIHQLDELRDLENLSGRKDIKIVASSPFSAIEINQEPVLKDIGSRYYKSPRQVILRYLIQRELSSILISGTRRELDVSKRVFDFQLSEDEMKKISGLRTGFLRRLERRLFPG